MRLLVTNPIVLNSLEIICAKYERMLEPSHDKSFRKCKILKHKKNFQ